jgi:hypothetical protein
MKSGLFPSGSLLEQEVVHPEVQEHVQEAPYQRCFIGHKGKCHVGFIDAHVLGRFVFELEVVMIITVISMWVRYDVPDAVPLVVVAVPVISVPAGPVAADGFTLSDSPDVSIATGLVRMPWRERIERVSWAPCMRACVAPSWNPSLCGTKH